jgi:transcriptional regulator with XRE-family HTH domain
VTMPEKKKTVKSGDSATSSRAKTAQAIVPAEDAEELRYNSPYRIAQRDYGADLDGFWEYLKANRDNDPTLNLGYHLMRVEREQGWNQSDVAGRTGVTQGGKVIDKPLTRGYISALLSGRSQAHPETLARVYRSMNANPAEYYRCKGWLDDAEIAAAVSPMVELAMPIIRKLASASDAMRPTLIAVVLASLDTLLMNRAEQDAGKTPTA